MSLTFTAAVRANKPKRNVGKINTTGLNNTKVIDRKGIVWGWGYNSGGQLGDNSTISRFTPVSVAGAVKTFCEISGGQEHTMAIDKNGRAWGWGGNYFGQLGLNIGGYANSAITPVSVLGAVKTFCKIAGGSYYTLAIDKNGRAWAWGQNWHGQLGNNIGGYNNYTITPVSVLGAVKTFCKIFIDNNTSVAIDKNGRAWAWGANSGGHLGDNSTISRFTPVSVAGAVKTFCEISGNGRTLAIDKNGRAWGWGYNANGQLGVNDLVASYLTPVSVAGAVKTFCKIAGTYYTSVAIDKNGKIWTWGTNSDGLLGINKHSPAAISLTPIAICGNKTFCQVSSGFSMIAALDKNNRLWTWGRTSDLGINYTTYKCTPVAVVGISKTFCSIVANGLNSGGIDKNGRLWMWGNGDFGQLGDNSVFAPQYTPISVLGAVKTFCKISIGGVSSGAIDKNGRLWMWGSNTTGQLGNNTTVSELTPISVLGAVKTFCKISVGLGNPIRIIANTMAAAIDKNGQVWTWGFNTSGQLGNNTTVSERTPISILGAAKTFCEISTSGLNCIAIDKNGRAWGWGANGYGRLGNNSISNSLTPVSVAGTVKTFCKISAGSTHTSAIDKNGQVWTWGNNAQGQLGDNTTVNKSTPIAISGATKTFCEISGSSGSVMAIDKNGRVWGWGLNNYGQLGDNTLTNALTPVSIAGRFKTFCKIFVGMAIPRLFSHTVAIDKDGKVWAWGYNRGQLGNDQGDFAKTPVQVCNV